MVEMVIMFERVIMAYTQNTYGTNTYRYSFRLGKYSGYHHDHHHHLPTSERLKAVIILINSLFFVVVVVVVGGGRGRG